MKVAFVGMTHLGLVSAIAAAAKGCHVLCYDPDRLLIEKLEKGTLPFMEPNLKETLALHQKQIRFTHNPDLLRQEKLVYIAPDIPTNDEGVSDLAPLRTQIQMLTPYIAQAEVVLHSQIPPGFCRTLALSHLSYHVETLIFGQALLRALHPERMIVGRAHPEKPLPSVLADYLALYEAPLLVMSYESAELTKIAINLFLISSVSTTNTLAQLCEKIGASWRDISQALRLDKRIGPHSYLTPGLGIAGGNLERDMVTFETVARVNGVDNSLVQSWQRISKRSSRWVMQKLQEKGLLAKATTRFALLGLAYKQNSSSCKNSPSLALLRKISSHPIVAYDPAVPDLDFPLERKKRAEETFEEADALLVMTPWEEFRKLPLDLLQKHFHKKWILDPFAILPAGIASPYYLTLGEPS